MDFSKAGFRNRSRSRSRSSSPSRRKSSHYSSRPTYARSSSSFFSFGGGGGNSAYSASRGHSSRARPRSGFLNRIRKFLRDVLSYMRRHPVKVFILVIMPLITGGALAKLLGQFGIRLPRGLDQLVGARGMGDAERFYARGGARDFGSGSALPGMGGGIGEGLGAVLGIAKNFI